MMTLVVFIMKTNGVTRKRSVWNYEQESGFMEKELLVSYSTKMFKQQKFKNSFHHSQTSTKTQQKENKM